MLQARGACTCIAHADRRAHQSALLRLQLRPTAGVLEGLEECDDGNTGDGDGCSASCMVSCRSLALVPSQHAAGVHLRASCCGGGALCAHILLPRLFSSTGWHPSRRTSQSTLPRSLPFTRRWSLAGLAAPPAPQYAPRAVQSHTASRQTRTLGQMLLQLAAAVAVVPAVAVATLRRHQQSTTAAAGPWPPSSWRRWGRLVPWYTLAGSACMTTSLRQVC